MNASGPQPPRCTSESETIPCGFEKKETEEKMKADPAEVCNDGERYIRLLLPCRGLIK